jgi:putative oxidoreductase
MSKGKKIALWVISILLGAMFVFSGLSKLLQLDQVKPMFVHYGYAPWFAVLIGTSEALGGIGLLIPRLAGIAAVGLSIIMAGAAYTHFSHREFGFGVIPVVLLALLIGVAYARLKESSAPGQ